MSLELVRRHRAFGGTQAVFRHASQATGTPMEFSIFLPPQAMAERRPVVFWLSGLTCTWANFTEKAGAQREAAALGLVLVAPDTSPRGLSLPGEDDTYDFGSGAGFYLDASEAPWSTNYRMYSYVAEELPDLVASAFNIDPGRMGISGHSMGGHGALTVAFKNPARFRSLSAFAPIVAPSEVPWGEKAFTGYLGGDRAAWSGHDACQLVGSSAWASPILVDQGTADDFLTVQLRPELFVKACASAGVPLTLRLQDGYDHSYYFIATFIAEHLQHHARLLGP
ncbi:MAG: S-formylglutathione hydrolase [Rhodospirillales bacterium]|nr:S-formylglutathione hydrolase [Rhodospirillales bacterium]